MKNKIIKIVIPIIIIIILIGITNFLIPYSNKIELYQLGNTTKSQMMGYFIRTSQNKNIVIDGGTPEDTEQLSNKIKKYGGKVDYWFITHPHRDHASAFVNIVDKGDIQIENVYVSLNPIEWYEQYEPNRSYEAQAVYDAIRKIEDKVHEVEIGQNIWIDSIKVEILGIKNPEITNNAINNSSMVFKMYINKKSLIFLGDTGEESGNKLIQNNKNKLKSNIVQMAHHGQAGANEELYKNIKPNICLWPSPDWLWDNNSGEGINSGKWKTMHTREWMQKLNVKKHIVEKDGTTKLKIW